ncbi:hypothetical protein UA08_05911 [Talaromyces atroroseus]|uniref:Nuc-1 negative regulatory protein preg n=1 Tax=Talaromyces atroroseus TaxID=1441469 RepID=A0A225ACY2_TALAT|nr:hypothetical protein UA08_05911 [Talaromyces atroroseus]OKL58992.1 hypothetical protein UA08_05911 [Talaromyces atroroseus]
MPTIIVSSPSSAALRSGACSPNRFWPSSPGHHNRQLSRASPIFHDSSPFAGAPAAAASPSSSSFHHAASRSRLSQGVEEIRAALKNHSVDAASQDPALGPSGDQSRSCMSAGPESLGGGTRPSLDTDSAHPPQPVTPAPPAAPLPITSSVSPTDVKGKRHLSEAIVSEQNPTQGNSGHGEAKQENGESEQTRLKRLRPPVPAIKLLPRQYELVHPNDLVILISSMIMELIQYNDTIPLQGGRLTRFHSRTPPRISVREYLQRLTTHATLSPPILLSMVYYIDRLCALYPAFTVSSLTVHRFLITSATVASKGLSDSFWTNKTYARVGGITITELALLELEFLWRVEWKIVPQPEVLVDYYLSLVERCEGYALEQEDMTPEVISPTHEPLPH